jgi:wyosine [tRNA(Phe)-imidazoG37] synthetase (radical SAM superfamily)
MGKCLSCNEFFPPEFMHSKEKCLYCEVGKDSVNIKNKNGVIEKYYKKQCVEDYKLFMRKLRDSQGVARALAKNEVNFTPKGE